MDSRTLRILAGLTHDEATDATNLFKQALEELGMSEITRSDAARICASAISRQIISGDLSPQEGANKIWDASIRVNDPGFHDLDPFIYAASELQSRPQDREFFNREIVKEAESWVGKWGT